MIRQDTFRNAERTFLWARTDFGVGGGEAPQPNPRACSVRSTVWSDIRGRRSCIDAILCRYTDRMISQFTKTK
jgi:hypothetical protein